MDRKIKLFVAASLVTILVSGCSNSNYRLGSQGADSGSRVGGSYGSGQVARTGQVAGSRRGGLFGQQARGSATCAPCAANASKPKPQSTYTYTPAPKAAPAPKRAPLPPRTAGQHSQQWYVDRWKREQNGAKQQQPKKNTNYSGYGSGNYTYDAASSSNTNYYDYSTAGKSKNTNANVSTSNKSIYTGSYQQKTYKPYNPTTYAGGSSATTDTHAHANSTAAASSGGSGGTYTVKKGDTVFEIMRQTGVYWKDIIRINNLQAPAYNINPGQIIRLK